MSTQKQVQKAAGIAVPFAGKSSFALDNAKKRSIQYLKNNNNLEQIPHIPDRYPTQLGTLAALDIVPRTKIPKAHLEDAFANNRFSIKITRRKITSNVLSITHDSTEADAVKNIAKLYVNSTTKLVVTKSQGIPLMIL